MSKNDTQNTAPVAPRKDPRKVEIFAHSRATELAGRDPNFHYEYFSDDPNHPQYVGKYLHEYERGRADVGYVRVNGWEVCSAKDGVAPGRARDDQGKAVDTAIRHGNLVLCRIPKDEYEKHKVIENEIDKANMKQMRQGGPAGGGEEVRDPASGGRARFRGTVQHGFAGDYREALDKADRET